MRSPFRPASAALRLLAALCSAFLLWLAAPAMAQDHVSFEADVSIDALNAERAVFDADDLDGSYLALRGIVGATWETGDTEVSLRVDGGIYEYSDPDRERREPYGATLEVRHRVSDTISVAVQADYSDNMVLLESRRASQKSARAEIRWEKGNDRVRVRGQWRERDYDDSLDSSGSGSRVDVQYNRRLGSWHWVRFGFALEDIDSDNPRRGYTRQIATIDYSLPIAKDLRLRAGVEARQWQYDERIALGAPDAALREDSMVRPMVGLNWGRSKGPYARARAYYEFRESNDERFNEDAPRFRVTVGYRF